jgi:hypothetical protein
MTEASAASDQQPQKGLLELYPPSWFDRLLEGIDRLPGPRWVVFPLVGLVLFALGVLLQWLEKSGTVRDWHPTYYLTLLQMPYVCWFLDYLDRYAIQALEVFRPALTVDDVSYAALQRRISTLPSRATLWVNLVSLIVVLTLGFLTRVVGPGESPTAVEFTATPFGAYGLLVFTLLWLANGLLFYHTYHQLRAVHRIYTRYAAIDPFRQGPLHAFSGLSARTAIGWMLPSLPWIWLDPGLISLVLALVFASAGVLAFISPLVGVRQVLGREKRRLLEDNSRQVQAVIADLSSQLQEGSYGETFQHIDDALSGLERARRAIEEIPTWPWRAETLRQVIAALVLPVVVWLLQYVLGQLLSR